MADCTFCKIINGKIPSLKLYETKQVIAIAPLKEHLLSKGHMLVIPKEHYENIYDIPEKEIAELMKAVKHIAEMLKEGYNSNGINILHASGKAAQQSVSHFHLHLVPRYENDGLDIWPGTSYKEENYQEVYDKIKKLF